LAVKKEFPGRQTMEVSPWSKLLAAGTSGESAYLMGIQTPSIRPDWEAL